MSNYIIFLMYAMKDRINDAYFEDSIFQYTKIKY